MYRETRTRRFVWCLLLSGLALSPASATCSAPHTTQIVAHRGSMSPEIPENSLAAIRWAALKGVTMVELDLRPSSTGEPVVIHDATLNRTTSGNGKVADLSVSQLRELSLANGEPIPTVKAVLNQAKDLQLELLFDMKNAEEINLDSLVADIKETYELSKVTFGVRTVSALESLRAISPDAKTLGFVRSPNQIDAFVDLDVDSIRLWGHRVLSDPEMVNTVQRGGTEVWVTTGPTGGKQLERILREGVSAVITDRPQDMVGKPCCC